MALITQLRLTRDHGVYARYRAQEFVNCLKFVVGHVPKDGPRHYLENVAVQRSRQAVRRPASGTGWM